MNHLSDNEKAMTQTDYVDGYFDAPDLEGNGKHRLHYLDWGSADAAQVVVCVHGLTRNAHDFDYLARAIAGPRTRVIAISMAGRGESAPLADPMAYSYMQYMADCLALLDNFHLRSVDWVGTSMGGVIGMMIAAMNPGRINKLVLNDIGSFIPKAGLRGILDYVHAIRMDYASQREAETQLQTNMAQFGIDEEEHWQHLFRYSIQQKNGAYGLSFDPRILEPIRAETKDFSEIHDIDLSELWDAIDIPVLVLRGADSTLLEPETVRAMRASNPKCQSVEFEGVGHAPALLKPEQYRHIQRFLGGATGIAAIAI